MTASAKPVVERRSGRSSAQEQIDLASYDKAVEAAEGLKGHEKVCAERYRNIEANIGEVKADIKELSRDARTAIDELADRQEGYHKANSETTGRLVAEIGQIAQKITSAQSKSDGERGAVNLILRNLPTIFTAIMLALTIWWHRS